MARNPFTRGLRRPGKTPATVGLVAAPPPDPAQKSPAEIRERAENDLETFGIPELEGLEARIARRIETLRSENEAETLETILKLAEQAGLSREELIVKLGGYLDEPGALFARRQKYRHPETGESWGGIGRKPNWVKRFEAGGGRLEDLAQAARDVPRERSDATAPGDRT